MRLSPLLAVLVLAHSWEIDEILSPLPPLSQAFRFPSGDDGAIKTSGAPPLSQTPQIDESLPIQQAEDDDQAAVAPWPEPLSLTQRRVPSVPPPPSPRQRVNRRISDAPPQVCLAFLSCCGRTDLLERTLAAALAHMEDDEPTRRQVPYEVAWVDNGSPGAVAVAARLGVSAALTPTGEKAHATGERRRDPNSDGRSAPMADHVWLAAENLGLAWGLNTLFFELCTAPFVLSLEEDWMYMDSTVAQQTPARRNAVALALAVASSGARSFDGRAVFGVFLRPETYDAFLTPPHAGAWQRLAPDRSGGPAAVEFRVYCGDVSDSSGYVWGSYTNGAALYNRTALHQAVGRVFGEPGDGFHEAYSEANYAYRASRGHCHALLRLEPTCPSAARGCNAAFYHVGGGRSTRPSAPQNVAAADPSWVAYGTPRFAPAKQATADAARVAGRRRATDALVEQGPRHGPPPARWADTRAAHAAYQARMAATHAPVFAREAAARDALRAQAQALRAAEGQGHETAALADRLDARANSPHPLPGYWDGMGAPLAPLLAQPPRAARAAQASDDALAAAGGAADDRAAKAAARAVELRAQAQVLRRLGPAQAKQQVPSWAGLSDAAVLAVADAAERLAADPAALALVLHAEQEQQHQPHQPPRSAEPEAARPSKAAARPPAPETTAPQTKTNKNNSMPGHEARQRKPPQQQPQQQQQQQQQKQQGRQEDVLRTPPAGGRPLPEAAAWAQAAHEHARTGRRAFTGGGYQEQHGRVQELLKERGNTPARSPWQVLMKALYGPGANHVLWGS